MPRPLPEVAAQLGISVQTLRRRMAEAGVRPVRVGRGPMVSQSDIAKLIEESRFRERVREEARKPRPPLTREELGQRIREGKERMRKFWAQPHMQELTQKWRAAEEERKRKAGRKPAPK